MKKIPTFFTKDKHGRYCIAEINHTKLGWIDDLSKLIPLRKYDGTPVYGNAKGEWFYRRAYKMGTTPPGFIECDLDYHSKKSWGWLPVDDDYPFKKYFDEALVLKPFDLDIAPGSREEVYEEGSYELIGPKINGNPEEMSEHRLMPHRRAPQISNIAEIDTEVEDEVLYEIYKKVIGFMPIEGVVFWINGNEHMESRPVAKLRKKDFNYDEA